MTEYQKRRAQRDAEFADKKSRAADEATRRGFARAQRETRESAHHHNHVWTGPEMELAARSDLTAREVADILGRTLAAVNNIRQKIRKDPKAARLAGLSTPLARKATP